MVNEVRFGRYGTPRDQLRPGRLAGPMLIATSWTSPLNTQFARSVGATSHEFTDNLSMARGPHLLKIGWNVRFGRQSNNTQGDNGSGIGIYPNVLFGRGFGNAPAASIGPPPASAISVTDLSRFSSFYLTTRQNGCTVQAFQVFDRDR